MKISSLISLIILFFLGAILLIALTDLSTKEFISLVLTLLPVSIAISLFIFLIILPLYALILSLLVSQYASLVLSILCLLVSYSLWKIDNETVDYIIKIDLDISLLSQIFDNAKAFSESQRQILYAGLLSCIPSWAARKAQKNFINWWCYSFLLFTSVEVFIIVAYIRLRTKETINFNSSTPKKILKATIASLFKGRKSP